MNADLSEPLLDPLEDYLDEPDEVTWGGPPRQARRKAPVNPETWGRTADAVQGARASEAVLPEAGDS